MKNVLKPLSFIIFILIIFSGFSCSAPQKSQPPNTSIERVFVFKEDQSQQCGFQKGIDLNEMSKELEGFKIWSQKKGNDGKMRITLCGAPTGQINIYEIDKNSLNEALKKDFQVYENPIH